jgi:hypothetical protein
VFGEEVVDGVVDPFLVYDFLMYLRDSPSGERELRSGQPVGTAPMAIQPLARGLDMEGALGPRAIQIVRSKGPAREPAKQLGAIVSIEVLISIVHHLPLAL